MKQKHQGCAWRKKTHAGGTWGHGMHGKRLWGCFWGLPSEVGLQFGCWTAGCDEAGLLQAWPAVVGLKTLGLGQMKITLVNKNK